MKRKLILKKDKKDKIEQMKNLNESALKLFFEMLKFYLKLFTLFCKSNYQIRCSLNFKQAGE